MRYTKNLAIFHQTRSDFQHYKSMLVFCSSLQSFYNHARGWWCSGFSHGFLRRRSGVRFPYPPVLEKCAKGGFVAIFVAVLLQFLSLLSQTTNDDTTPRLHTPEDLRSILKGETPELQHDSPSTTPTRRPLLHQ